MGVICDKKVPVKLKVKIYLPDSTMLYGAECCWAMRKKEDNDGGKGRHTIVYKTQGEK